MLTDNYKDTDNLNTFKNKIKKWKPENCPCRLCKVYIKNFSFVSEEKRNLEYSIAFEEVFLLFVSIVLLTVPVSFPTFLTLTFRLLMTTLGFMIFAFLWIM